MHHSDKFLLTVHGVNSNNDGLKKVRTTCERELPGIAADSFFFGKVLPFKELTESVRLFVYRTLRDRLEIITAKHITQDGRKCFVVAHSFGTLAIVRALEMQVPHLRIEGLVLLGSVVPPDYYWDGFIQAGTLAGPPLAIVRPFDLIVRKANCIGGGPSGGDGFIANGQHCPLESFKNGGHGAYDRDDVHDIVTAVRDGLAVVPRKDRCYRAPRNIVSNPL